MRKFPVFIKIYKIAGSDLLFLPKQKCNAKLFLKPFGDSLQVQWQILPEDWYNSREYPYSKTKLNKLFPPIISSNSFDFEVPKKGGPYRLFALVIGNNKTSATINAPFYVID